MLTPHIPSSIQLAPESEISLQVGQICADKPFSLCYFQNVSNRLSSCQVMGTKLTISKSGGDMSPMRPQFKCPQCLALSAC